MPRIETLGVCPPNSDLGFQVLRQQVGDQPFFKRQMQDQEFKETPMGKNRKIFRRVKSKRVSDTVANQIIGLIEEGKLQIGDMLPSERELVHQL